MTRIVHRLTYEVTFFNAEGATKVQSFMINVDQADYVDPKDAAIDHITAKWEESLHQQEPLSLPKFRTFRVLGSQQLSDLGWN